MKIYTKTGDDGTTSLFNGERVSKSDLLVETYGTIDELNTVLGLSLSVHTKLDRLRSIINELQQLLFNLGADLASGKTAPQKITQIHIEKLEFWIDELEVDLPPLTRFIIPGGHLVSAYLQNARTVCRRAERLLIRVHNERIVADIHRKFINRLSDLLFVLSRHANQVYLCDEVFWER